MKKFFQTADTTVKEMWIGIAVWGVACELATVWLVKDRLGCALGLFIGCILAAAGVYHMWSSIDTALDLGDGAQKFMTGRSWMRYGVFVAVFAVLMVTEFADPLTAFLGLMGMKISAYLQPVVHKLYNRRR